jgi:hypothetical protein
MLVFQAVASSLFGRSVRLFVGKIPQQSTGVCPEPLPIPENMQTCDNRNAPDLIRGLGLWSAIAVIVGSMIGHAVFLVASDMARQLGSPTRVLAVWIIGGIVVLFARMQ